VPLRERPWIDVDDAPGEFDGDRGNGAQRQQVRRRCAQDARELRADLFDFVSRFECVAANYVTVCIACRGSFAPPSCPGVCESPVDDVADFEAVVDVATQAHDAAARELDTPGPGVRTVATFDRLP
jgi:hypothetical protein